MHDDAFRLFSDWVAARFINYHNTAWGIMIFVAWPAVAPARHKGGLQGSMI